MYIEVAAHRGNVALCPENTMPAFASAYEIGADMIELDLRMTKDGEIVLMHDMDISRTTDMAGRVRDLTLAELKKADAGIKKGEEFKGTRIPTLKEFLDYVSKQDENMQFNFEFKDYFRDGEEFAKTCADKIIALVDSYGLWDRSFVNSFDGALLRYIEEKYEGRFRLHGFYPYSILGEVCPEKLYCACLWRHEKVTGPVNPEEDFEALKAAGVHPWVGAGIKKIEDMVLAAGYGAELITSNEPAFMMAELEKAGLRVKE